MQIPQDTANKIKDLAKAKGVSVSKILADCEINKNALNTMQSSGYFPRVETLTKLADYLGVSVDYLLGREVDNNLEPVQLDRNVRKIPVFGVIPAGTPVEAIEDVLDFEEIPEAWTSGDREFFALKIRGDSMFPEYLDGDIVIFLKQSTCESGDDCAVLINGNDATFKRVFFDEHGLTVKPINPIYKPITYTRDDIEALQISIIGVFWELRRKRKM